MNSLKIRLILLLSIGFGLAWALAAWLTHLEARQEVDELFDAQLVQSAQVLLGTADHVSHERMERRDEGEVVETQVMHEYEQKLSFQIWNGASLIVRSTLAPTLAFSPTEQGFSEIKYRGQRWRVFAHQDERHRYKIQVAEPLAPREALARHIASKMLIPLLIALPLIVLLVWFGVRAGLSPLAKIEQEIKQRALNQLAPLNMGQVPDEVAPLVLELNNLFSRLQQAFNNEQQFTADAAHELRTPLAALKVQAQVAMRANDEVERQSALVNVLRGVDRATHLVSQLLSLARLDPESVGTDFEQIEWGILLDRLINDALPLAQVKNIHLNLNVLPRQNLHQYLPIQGNPLQLELLVRNLLDNAVRYSPNGADVTVSLTDNEASVVLEVADTGPGMSEPDRQNVLRRFYRVPGSGESGSGLGLSIAQKIAELHRAQLTLIENPAGQGLLVRVVFSRKHGAQKEAVTSVASKC